jgi:hypothetical protein
MLGRAATQDEHNRQAAGEYMGRLPCKAVASIGAFLRDLIRAGS